jgi:hypothetical protein
MLNFVKNHPLELALAVAGVVGLLTLYVREANRPPPQLVVRACLVKSYCGTKDGKRKEYSTLCDAEDDRATDVAPMSGDRCP